MMQRFATRPRLMTLMALAVGLAAPTLAAAAAAGFAGSAPSGVLLLRANAAQWRLLAAAGSACGRCPQLARGSGPRTAPTSVTPLRGASHRQDHRPAPVARRHGVSGIHSLDGRRDDMRNRRRSPASSIPVRTMSRLGRWRVQSAVGRLDRHLVVSGALFYEAHAPPRRTATHRCDSL
jgi:hypothetical protein